MSRSKSLISLRVVQLGPGTSVVETPRRMAVKGVNSSGNDTLVVPDMQIAQMTLV
jgi:hypothetical protein